MSWASYLWPRAERAARGRAARHRADGEISTANLRRNRLTRSEIESEMRLAGIAQLRDVAWAILEPRGKISFIQRSEARRRRRAAAAAEERRGRRRRLSRAQALASVSTMSSRWADELAFATDLARRAGALLTDSYERLERIDYKSKRDVVTNADYASERARDRRHQGPLPGRRDPGRGVRRARRRPARRRLATTGGPGSSTRSTARSTTRTASRTTASASAWWSTTGRRSA